MPKKFNLADYLPSMNVSNPDTMEIVRIPWDHITANEANFYSVDDVEDLFNSIRMHGLLDPVVVTPDEDPDRYLLISGHRRHKAWGLLREEDPEKYASIPAVVRSFESKAMAELALIMANSSARKLTSPEISRQAERIERLLYDLKEEGYEFDGRMRDQVAKACQVSSTKLARLKVIRENLLTDFRVRWEKGDLNESCAYELAQASSVIQEKILRAAPNATSQGIAKVRQIMEAGNDYGCAALTGPGCLKCTHGYAFLRHDLEDPWNTCEGKRCCLECEKAKRDWNPCGRMCSKAKEKRTEANAKEKAKEAREAEKKKNALLMQIRESALRLLKAADAAGVADSAEIKLSGYGSKNVSWVRRAASGGDIGYVYFNELDPVRLDVAAVARTLGCSADYICGLTDDLQPQRKAAPMAVWRNCEADPPDEGMKVVVLDHVWGLEKATYKDGLFIDPHGDDMDSDSRDWWIPFPDMPEKEREDGKD